MGCLLWPFTLVIGIVTGVFGFAMKLVGLILGAVGGVFGLIFAVALGGVGVLLCMTIIGAIIGIP
jgi:membrane associated rhomboid family serine protease